MVAQPASVADLKKVAEGREAEMYEWADGKLLRLLRPGFSAASLDRELLGSRAAAEAGVRVPATFERVTLDGRPGVVVERIPGRDLLAEIGAQPWKIWSIGGACGELHARLNAAPGIAELPQLSEQLAEQILRSDRVPGRYHDFVLSELKSLPEGDQLTHNDFHPANVMRADDGLVVIDWPNAMRGDPHADFARSTLMLKLGEPPPSAPWLIRFGAKFARRLLKASYERAYRRSRSLDETLLKRWELVRAIHRLQDGIDEERDKILRLIDQRIPTR